MFKASCISTLLTLSLAFVGVTGSSLVSSSAQAQEVSSPAEFATQTIVMAWSGAVWLTMTAGQALQRGFTQVFQKSEQGYWLCSDSGPFDEDTFLSESDCRKSCSGTCSWVATE